MINLRQIRESEGLTIDQVCEKSGINRGNLSQIETGQRVPRVNTLESILNAMGYELTCIKIQETKDIETI